MPMLSEVVGQAGRDKCATLLDKNGSADAFVAMSMADLDPNCEACMHPQRKRAHTCHRAKPVMEGAGARRSSYTTEEMWGPVSYPGIVDSGAEEMVTPPCSHAGGWRVIGDMIVGIMCVADAVWESDWLWDMVSAPRRPTCV